MKLNLAPRSFQFRLALLAATGAALILAILGISGYLWLKQSSLAKVDQSLRAHAASIFGSPRRPFPWRHIEAQLSQSYPTTDGPEIIILGQGVKDDQFYRSDGWPLTLDPRKFLPGMQLHKDWKNTKHFPERRRRRHGPDSPSPESEESRPAPGNDLLPHFDPGSDSRQLARALEPTVLATITSGTHNWRIGAFVDEQDNLLIGRRLNSVQADLSLFRNSFLFAAPIALLFAFGAAAFIARRAIQPVTALTTTLQNVTAEGLQTRIAGNAPYIEFEQLSASINQMLERLEQSFDQARRFSGLAAHELKTPLTVLQGKIDLALHAEKAGSVRQQFLTGLLEDVNRLKGVTDRLLLLSRADAGHLDLHIGPVNVSELLEDHVQDTEILAPLLRIETAIAKGVIIQGDKTLINQVLQNLFSNAIRHNIRGEGAFIRIELAAIKDWIRMGICNSADPVPADMQDKIFNRFQRGKHANAMAAGAGLGLSLAREIARAHGGTLKLKESTSAQTVFVLKLPFVPVPPLTVSTNWRLINRVK